MYSHCRDGLPITHLSLSVHYCETCFGYVVFASMHRQADGDEMTTLWHETMRFGPFDSWEDVHGWTLDKLLDPGHPA